MKQTIHFGTSGWRDIIADGFTFDHVTAVTRAIARQVKAEGTARRGVSVGRDYRFLAERFAERAAAVLAEEGIPVHWVREAAPTPVLAAAIIDHGLAGGINFTASHNPAEYQGLKWSNAHGGPATKEEIAPIEREANRLIAQGGGRPPRTTRPAPVTLMNPRAGYLKRLAALVPFPVLRRAHLNVVADPLYGAGRGYLDDALRRAGCRVTTLHDWRDALFGGRHPEPDEENLQEAVALMKRTRAQLVLGTDGDADRFGVVDRDGTFLTPNQILALTVYLLVKHRGWKGRVVRSVVTSHLVDAVARRFGLPVEVTPVGFKYIGESMQREGFLVGGEESGGLTIARHVPEKDGILACLLMAELVVRERTSLGAVLRRMYRETGLVVTGRINVSLSSRDQGEAIRRRLERRQPARLAGRKVTSVDRMDGFKYLLDDDSWLAIRLSGTEPVARIYLEAGSAERLKRLAAAGQTLLHGRA